MTELAKDVAAIDVTELLTRYGFDLSESTLDRLVDAWLNRYPTQWIRLAVIEALYQGRYKAISVEQILNLWQRRGKSLYHFNREFERMVCGRFSYTQFSTPEPRFAAASRSTLNSSIPRASVPQASSPSLSTQPVSKLISSDSTPEISTPQPALPQGEMGSSESIALPESALDANGRAANKTENSETSAPETAKESSPPEFSTIPLSQPSLSQISGSPVTTFQPADSLDLEPLVTVSAARSVSQHQPIHHFVPSSPSSDFYAKLRAVAQTTVVAGNGD